MSDNREVREDAEFVNVLLGLQRKSKCGKKSCLRMVERGRDSLEVFEAKLRVLGGDWRIHRTVNPRCVKKALKVLMHALIEYPEKAAYVDAEWRTALLNSKCKYSRNFMLDIDTEDEEVLAEIERLMPEEITLVGEGGTHIPCHYPILKRIKSPKGWHYITEPFDTREICKLEDVTLLRDGYYFVKEIKDEE